MQDSCRLTEEKRKTQVRRERRYFWGPILSSSRGGSDYTNMSGSRLLGCSKVVSAFRVVRASELGSLGVCSLCGGRSNYKLII